jgi:DNA-binding NtrC family response regulator
MTLKPVVLVVDDEPGVREAIELALEDAYQTFSAEDGRQAMEILRTVTVSMVFLDITMPGKDGIAVLADIKAVDPSAEVVMVSALNTAEKAVAAMKLGAYDYLVKPFSPDDLLAVAEKIVTKQALQREVAFLRSELAGRSGFGDIVSRDRRMLEVFDLIRKVAPTSSSVLITGESGTGKELVARLIHRESTRHAAPFVAVNCAAVPHELMESEFFGHERGAFTGAYERKIGRFEFASGGTLFLDEIGSLPLALQAKLLRVLQEREIQRVGSPRSVPVDVRIVAASNADLGEAIRRGTFRHDLFFRLNVVPIVLPPLRERKDDIPLLAEHFLIRITRSFRKAIPGFTPQAREVLARYRWPGNIRELENLIERLVVLGRPGEPITVNDLPAELFGRDLGDPTAGDAAARRTLKEARDAFERRYILRMLDETGGNQSRAAQLLGIHRNTLMAKLDELGIREDVGAIVRPRRRAEGPAAAGAGGTGDSPSLSEPDVPHESRGERAHLRGPPAAG